MQDIRQRHTGYAAFFLSGICAISSGVIVSILRDSYGFSFAQTGTMLSLMNTGNMAAAFLAGWLPRKIGTRLTILCLCAGYALGYASMALSQTALLLSLCFLLLGLAKGATLNRCTVMVGMNTPDRPRAMQLMHSLYACGALLCPFLASALSAVSPVSPMLGLAVLGGVMWCLFAASHLPGRQGREEKKTRSSAVFLHSSRFWLLTAMVFCQNAAETGVTGWLVTYYRDQQILSGILSAYTMTVMWSATLLARLLIAFVLPIRNRARALAVMGGACFVLYAVMIPLKEPVPAIAVLFLFSAAIAGVNPMSTAMTGESMTPESMGVLLPVAACGAIVMPAVIGLAANQIGLEKAMLLNLIPCLGIMVLGMLLCRNPLPEGEAHP